MNHNDKGDDRCREIYEMRLQGKTLQQVAEQVGLTRERVRQLQNRYCRKTGLPQPQITMPGVGIEEASTITKLVPGTLREAARRGKLPYFKHGQWMRFHRADLEAWVSSWKCCICQQPLPRYKMKVCKSETCQKRHKQNLYLSLSSDTKCDDHGLWGLICRALQECSYENDTRILAPEAARTSGLTQPQLQYGRMTERLTWWEISGRSRDRYQHSLREMQTIAPLVQDFKYRKQTHGD